MEEITIQYYYRGSLCTAVSKQARTIILSNGTRVTAQAVM